MTSSSLLPAESGELSPACAPEAATARIAVVDIGSNSVRLVVFDGLSRAALTVHNEKTICSIGRELGTTGLLYKEGVELALDTLRRYRHLCDRLGVDLREVVATAAARDALNGPEFVRRAESAWGGPVRVLTGPEEARLAGEGVLAAMPDADGLVADLGGGSLDMVTVRGGRTADVCSLPFGPLRLADLSKGDLDRTRKLVDDELEQWTPLKGQGGKTLFLVGGIWRSIARVDMLREQYPLHMLQHYTIPSERALELCQVLSKQGKKSLELLSVVSKRRVDLLPYGATVLHRLLSFARFKELVISATGVREGLVFAKLAAEERGKDPLIEHAASENARVGRAPGHAQEVFAWGAPLLPTKTSTIAVCAKRPACSAIPVGAVIPIIAPAAAMKTSSTCRMAAPIIAPGPSSRLQPGIAMPATRSCRPNCVSRACSTGKRSDGRSGSDWRPGWRSNCRRRRPGNSPNTGCA